MKPDAPRELIWTQPQEGFNSIDGGVDDGGNLVKLAHIVAHPGMIGFEVGCYTGTTACSVLPVFKENDGSYHCLDWFRGSVNTTVGRWHWIDGAFDSSTVLIQTLKNFEVMGFRDIVTLSIAQGEQLAPLIKDGIADYIYIGADHRYSAIRQDIISWLPKLRAGGVLCGHAFTGDCEPGTKLWEDLCASPEQDLYSQGFHFGVTRAVRELLPNFERDGQIWWSYK